VTITRYRHFAWETQFYWETCLRFIKISAFYWTCIFWKLPILHISTFDDEILMENMQFFLFRVIFLSILNIIGRYELASGFPKFIKLFYMSDPFSLILDPQLHSVWSRFENDLIHRYLHNIWVAFGNFTISLRSKNVKLVSKKSASAVLFIAFFFTNLPK